MIYQDIFFKTSMSTLVIGIAVVLGDAIGRLLPPQTIGTFAFVLGIGTGVLIATFWKSR